MNQPAVLISMRRFEIYNLMKKLADAGMAILLVSSELPESTHRERPGAGNGRRKINELKCQLAEATESNILKYAIQHNITA